MRIPEKFYRQPYTTLHKLAHLIIIYCLLFPYYRLNYKLSVHGRRNVPTDRPVLIVSNHFSYNDPTLLSLATGLPISYIAKEELFSDPKIQDWIRFLGAIPINREKPQISTIKRFKEAISKNWSCGIFIEGTRNQSRQYITSLTEGAAFFARIGNKLDVLPVGISGGENKGDKLSISIGEIIPYDDSLSAQEITLIYGKAIAKLAGLEVKLDT